MVTQLAHPSRLVQDAAGFALTPGGYDARSSPAEGFGLPTFVSSAPPRSEGEALLRRIFSRSGRG
jgi:hypothetical protein